LDKKRRPLTHKNLPLELSEEFISLDDLRENPLESRSSVPEDEPADVSASKNRP